MANGRYRPTRPRPCDVPLASLWARSGSQRPGWLMLRAVDGGGVNILCLFSCRLCVFVVYGELNMWQGGPKNLPETQTKLQRKATRNQVSEDRPEKR